MLWAQSCAPRWAAELPLETCDGNGFLIMQHVCIPSTVTTQSSQFIIKPTLLIADEVSSAVFNAWIAFQRPKRETMIAGCSGGVTSYRSAAWSLCQSAEEWSSHNMKACALLAGCSVPPSKA